MSKPKTLALQCTSAFMAGGKMILPKQVVGEVPHAEALSLVRRGKAKVIDSVFDGYDPEVDIPALEDLTVDELKDIAEEHEIEGASKLKKAELIEAIRKAELGDAE